MKRMIATLLVVAMLLPTAYAASSTADRAYDDISEAIALTALNTPEVISAESILENGHIARLSSEEPDLNSIALLNEDRSTTLYYFQNAVKYVDETGMVQDKSNQLYSVYDDPEFAQQYAFYNRDNNIRTYFPQSLSAETGVILRTDTDQIMIAPTTTTAGEVIKIDNSTADSVYYCNPFGAGTELNYTPTFDGFKEEIVISDNKLTEFAFELDTGNLVPTYDNGNLYISDGLGKIIMSMDPVYVYDSSSDQSYIEDDGYCHNTWNNVIELEYIGGSKYKILIHADENFLQDSRTQYPVYIDPSFRVVPSGGGTSKTIQDVPLYDGTGARTVACGKDSHALVGLAGTVNGKPHGVGRLLIKFPGLLDNTVFKTINPSDITKVTLNMKERSGVVGYPCNK